MDKQQRAGALALPKSDLSVGLLFPILYFFGRLVLFLALVPDHLYGAGDLPLYFSIAGLKGWPFLDYLVEYPPLFPFLNALLYRLAGGQEVVYDFLMVGLISLAGAVSLYLFYGIAKKLYGEGGGLLRTLVYFGILSILPYTWWYFDLIPAALMLLAIYALLEEWDGLSGAALGLGILAKWFPALLIPAIWRFRPRKSAAWVSLLALGSTALVIGGLLLASPGMASASLLSQPGRSSWETVWALIDGNFRTGSFIPLSARYTASLADVVRGNPAVIPSGVTLAVFGLLGLGLFWKARSRSSLSLLAFIGITWVVYLAWSPGWSPQWILYLIPLILLSLPVEKGFFWTILLVLLTILEWPVTLARHLWVALWLIAPLRLGIFVALAMNWYRQLFPADHRRLLVREA